MIIDPKELSLEEIQKLYEQKLAQTGQKKLIYTPDEVVKKVTDLDSRIPKVTMRALRALPIPAAPKQNPSRFTGVARQEAKLHCVHCGKKREMKVATSMLESDGTITLLYLNFQKMMRALKDPTFPIPKNIVANCQTCKGTTYYRVNKNRKLQVEK